MQNRLLDIGVVAAVLVILFTLWTPSVRVNVVLPEEGFLGRVAKHIPPAPGEPEKKICIDSWFIFGPIVSNKEFKGKVEITNYEHGFQQQLPFHVKPGQDPLLGQCELVVNEHGDKVWFTYEVTLDK